MKKLLQQLFLNDRIIMGVILLNAVCIYLQTSGLDSGWILWTDDVCTLIFVAEMLVKHSVYGMRAYWRDGWNRMDGTLVILSLPSLLTSFINMEVAGLSVLLVLRLLRVLKFFRLMRFFPNFSKIITGFQLAMKESWAVLAAFTVIVFTFGLINCSLFGNLAPQFFATPLDAVYSVFRMFTIEGWYEIPDAVAAASSPMVVHLVRLYFVLLLIGGGIIGMSFLNSIFVDAMVEDNHDDIKEQLKSIEHQLTELQKQLKEK